MESNQLTVIGERLDAFREAVSRAGMRKRMERGIRPLEIALRKAFREQGNLLARKLRQVKRFFAEGGDPFTQHDAWLNSKFSEALPPDEFNFIWAQVQSETVALIAKPVEEAVMKALLAGGVAGMAEMGMKPVFDLKNPRAVKYLQDYGATMVTGVNDTTRGILQTLITQAGEEGWSYKKTAEAIIAKFEEFGVGRPQDHIDSRAHLIAVTELGNAYEEGNRIPVMDLQDAGIEMEKSWSTVGDGKVSQGCLDNEAEGWIRVDQAHSSGHQRPLRFPGCRCEERYRRKKSSE